tara:strand:- start:89145 stop:89381 length:237 start_codon:yes stop_codon:yes gene_type:complete
MLAGSLTVEPTAHNGLSGGSTPSLPTNQHKGNEMKKDESVEEFKADFEKYGKYNPRRLETFIIFAVIIAVIFFISVVS